MNSINLSFGFDSTVGECVSGSIMRDGARAFVCECVRVYVRASGCVRACVCVRVCAVTKCPVTKCPVTNFPVKKCHVTKCLCD